MREIKFRVWHKGQMFYDCDLNAQGEIMQFTGLRDREGKEIWEGDVVAFYPGFSSEPKSNHEVIYKLYRFCLKGEPGKKDRGNFSFAPFDFPSFGELDHQNMVEVLGNIYENPELLNA